MLRLAAERAPALDGRFADLLQRIADGLLPEGMETAAPLIFDRLPTPAELLPAGSWVVVARSGRSRDRARQAHPAMVRAEHDFISAAHGACPVERKQSAAAGDQYFHGAFR